MNNGWGLATANAIGLLPTLDKVVWLRALVGGAGPKHPKWNVVGTHGVLLVSGEGVSGEVDAQDGRQEDEGLSGRHQQRDAGDERDDTCDGVDPAHGLDSE